MSEIGGLGQARPLSAEQATMIDLRNQITMMGLEIGWKTAKLSAQAAVIDEAIPYLHMVEMGGEMHCLVCGEGNEGELPEHREGCELAKFIAKIKSLKDGGK